MIHGPTTLLLSVSTAVCLLLPGGRLAPRQDGAAPRLAVHGNQIVDGTGRPIQLRGVNRAGGEYACIQGWGIFDGPTGDEAVEAIRSWGANAVRIPLNEDCWLGAAGLDPALSSVAYRSAVVAFADRLAGHGLNVVLDLHWSATGDHPAVGQEPMADRRRAIAFWASVATAFRERPWAMFDVFNEPHDISWECWRDGCGGYAGMQDLVDAVRTAGATQPIVVSGIDWANDLRGWLRNRPYDPEHALVAGAHIYDLTRCSSTACWQDELDPVAARVPVVVTEFGDTDCSNDLTDALTAWADTEGVSYLAWTWNPWDCSGGPALIEDFHGTATPYGQVVRARLLAPHEQIRSSPPLRSICPRTAHALE